MLSRNVGKNYFLNPEDDTDRLSRNVGKNYFLNPEDDTDVVPKRR
jgi:hypothetical protein